MGAEKLVRVPQGTVAAVIRSRRDDESAGTRMGGGQDVLEHPREVSGTTGTSRSALSVHVETLIACRWALAEVILRLEVLPG